MAIFAALGWGLWWFPLRHLATLDMPMVQVNAGLMGLGAMMLTPLMLVPGLRNGLWHWATLVSGGLLGVSLVFWHHALVEGDVLAAAVLFYLSPVWGGMIGRVFFGDGFNPGRLLAVFLACIAAVVMLGLDRPHMAAVQKSHLLALSAGVAFALSGAAARMGPAGWFPRIWVALALGALALLPIRGGIDLPVDGHAVQSVLLVLSGPALVGLCLVLPMQLAAGQMVRPRGRDWFLPALLMVELAAAGLSAALLAGEAFGPRQWLGVSLIMGVAVLERCRQSAGPDE